MEHILTPQEYKDQFDAKVAEYIETQFGTREQYIEEEMERLHWENIQLEKEVEPEFRTPGLYSEAIEFGLTKYINANKRKMEFLEELSKNTNVVIPDHLNGCLKMSPTEAVELIRAMEKAGCLNVQLSDMYELFGRLISEKINGSKISNRIKERSTPYFIQRLGKGWDDFLEA